MKLKRATEKKSWEREETDEDDIEPHDPKVRRPTVFSKTNQWNSMDWNDESYFIFDDSKKYGIIRQKYNNWSFVCPMMVNNFGWAGGFDYIQNKVLSEDNVQQPTTTEIGMLLYILANFADYYYKPFYGEWLPSIVEKFKHKIFNASGEDMKSYVDTDLYNIFEQMQKLCELYMSRKEANKAVEKIKLKFGLASVNSNTLILQTKGLDKLSDIIKFSNSDKEKELYEFLKAEKILDRILSADSHDS